MSAKSDDEFKNPERTRQRDPDKEEREKAQIKAGELYSSWRGQFVNTVAQSGDEILGRLLVLRSLISEGITHKEVRENHLKQIDYSIKEARKKWPDTSPKGKRKAKRDEWAGRNNRKSPGPGDDHSKN